MLKTLILKNLILIESAEISFETGMTAITGETGAGKTALIEALKFLLGERADASKIRKGAEKAFIQGEFDLSKNTMFIPLLEQQGISLESEEACVITREIQSTGKSRCFIAGQLIPLNLLQKIAPFLVEIVDQHAHVQLRSEEYQRTLLDLFGDLHSYIQNFQLAWSNEKQVQEKLQKNLEEQIKSDQRKIWLQDSLEELKSSNIQIGEDEKLFKEYSYLANIQDLLEKGSLAIEGISSILPQLFQLQTCIKEMHRYDSSLEETYKSLKEMHLQMDEIRYFLQNKLGKMETDPYRLLAINERIKLIEKLKKKYGADLSFVQTQLEKEWVQMEDLQTQIEQISKDYEIAKKNTNEAANRLTDQRTLIGQKLALALSQNLKQLNIPDAKVDIRVKKGSRTIYGEDDISFYLQANAGEESLHIKESASGGELARLLFCVKIALANKNHAPTIVFDEIDANVGGKTADLMGKKLHELGGHRQIICITHFPQVAKYGKEHFSIVKDEEKGRTITRIRRLDQGKKHQEMLRMLGGEAINIRDCR